MGTSYHDPSPISGRADCIGDCADFDCVVRPEELLVNIFERIWNAITGRGGKLRSDDFPPNVPCVEARAEAVKWYQNKWHSEPVIPPVRVVVTDTPPDGHGADTQASGRGYLIRIWRDQNPFFASLVHEFAHAIKRENGKGAGEDQMP